MDYGSRQIVRMKGGKISFLDSDTNSDSMRLVLNTIEELSGKSPQYTSTTIDKFQYHGVK